MSGSLVFLSGVGTQMMMASHSFRRRKSVVAVQLPSPTHFSTFSAVTSTMYERPAFISAVLGLIDLEPDSIETFNANSTINGRPT
jgi:hypothetical protein